MISIHALREEGDFTYARTGSALILFLSTPSVRRATRCSTIAKRKFCISIHALREEGDSGASRAKDRWRISIHALREEGDFRQSGVLPTEDYFYPRPP